MTACGVLTSSEGDDGLGDGLAAALNFPEVFVRIFWVGRNIRAAVTPCGQRVCNSRLRVLRVKFELCCPRDHIAMLTRASLQSGWLREVEFPGSHDLRLFDLHTRRNKRTQANLERPRGRALCQGDGTSPHRALRSGPSGRRPNSAAKELRRMPAERISRRTDRAPARPNRKAASPPRLLWMGRLVEADAGLRSCT